MGSSRDDLTYGVHSKLYSCLIQLHRSSTSAKVKDQKIYGDFVDIFPHIPTDLYGYHRAGLLQIIRTITTVIMASSPGTDDVRAYRYIRICTSNVASFRLDFLSSVIYPAICSLIRRDRNPHMSLSRAYASVAAVKFIYLFESKSISVWKTATSALTSSSRTNRVYHLDIGVSKMSHVPAWKIMRRTS